MNAEQRAALNEWAAKKMGIEKPLVRYEMVLKTREWTPIEYYPNYLTSVDRMLEVCRKMKWIVVLRCFSRYANCSIGHNPNKNSCFASGDTPAEALAECLWAVKEGEG